MGGCTVEILKSDKYESGYGNSYGYGTGGELGNGYGSEIKFEYGAKIRAEVGYGYNNGSGPEAVGWNRYAYGSGFGDGNKYWMAVFKTFFSHISGNFLAFWKSSASGTPANGGKGTIAKNGLVEIIHGPLKICSSSAHDKSLGLQR
jgi:hypothetical protein